MQKERLIFLLTGAKDNKLSDQEKEELDNFLSDPSNREFFIASVSSLFDSTTALPEFHAALLPILEKTLSIDRPASVPEVLHSEKSGKHIPLYKRRWLRYAAAILVVLAAVMYFSDDTRQRPPAETVKVPPVPVESDIAPGGNKAVLTLADGSTIILDSTANGQLTRQNGSVIIKRADGQLEYQRQQAPQSGTVGYNTMSTPNSGQYQLILPDGSMVLLNAASSITYPTAFTGKERKVSITGEAYFEVARNTTMPFIVTTRSETITVLGTHFNIHAYEDDGPVKTSLLEGSVSVGGKKLTPGQAYRDGAVFVTDLEQDVAWKNGLFNFNNVDLPTAMRQLARWYDLEVRFEGKIPDKVIRGEMGRDLRLSQVLNILNKLGMNFRLDGRILIVSP